MIALILGGARTVWSDLEAAEALLGKRRPMVVAANLAGIEYPGPLAGWATHHPEHLAGWLRRRKGPAPARIFTLKAFGDVPGAEVTADLWRGSSGLYAAQVALMEMGATGAILCGIPMDADAGHFTGRPQWESVTSYRLGFKAALPLIGGRVRSMGGWTADLFGRPSDEWVGAISTAKPMGATASADSRIDHMHHVKNTGKVTAKFWARDPQSGLMKLHRLAPGHAVDADIDPNQAKFAKGGDLSVTAARTAPTAPKKADKSKSSGNKRAAATRAAAKAPAEPASEEA